MNGGTLLTLAGIDSRRPASWIALASGAVAGWCSGRADAHPWAASLAVVLPALAVVAAIGDVPLDICRTTVGRVSSTRLVASWVMERAAWPLIGGLIGAAVTTGTGASAAATVLVGLVAALLALLVVGAVRLLGRDAADAAALAMTLAAAAAAAHAVARSIGVGEPGALALAATVWCLVAALAWGWLRSASMALDRTLSAGAVSTGGGVSALREAAEAGRELVHLEPMPAAGDVQRGLENAAMLTALAAMVGWLVLDADHPDHPQFLTAAAWGWAGLAAAWFVCLAVPRAVLGDGVCGTPSWDRLFLSAASRPRHARRGMLPTARLRVGGLRFALATALPPATILGWPPLVGGLLSLTSPTRAWAPLAITAGLAVAAVSLAGVVAAGRSTGAARESVFATLLALVVAAAGGGLLYVEATGSTRPPSPPIPPRLPSLVGGWPLHRLPRFSVVERDAGEGWAGRRRRRRFHVEENAAPCEASALTALPAG